MQSQMVPSCVGNIVPIHLLPQYTICQVKLLTRCWLCGTVGDMVPWLSASLTLSAAASVVSLTVGYTSMLVRKLESSVLR